MRLAYADPPYPGKAHLYPENREVDHSELVELLEEEYNGWALSTDERSLQYVLGLCPGGVRVAAWCRSNAPPFLPYPYAAWEPVIVRPARKDQECIPAYYVGGIQSGFRQRDGLVGQKSPGFCEWVIRCLGAVPTDTLDDLFPGTGVMGETWRRWQTQPPLFHYAPRSAGVDCETNKLARVSEPITGLDAPAPRPERTYRR